jgi:hypothetical protein
LEWQEGPQATYNRLANGDVHQFHECGKVVCCNSSTVYIV